MTLDFAPFSGRTWRVRWSRLIPLFAFPEDIRIPFRATHRGAFFGVAPTGKQINVTETLIARIKDGKVVEMWEEYDQLGILQQPGAGAFGQVLTVLSSQSVFVSS